jgi:cytoskeleton protein RodZ
MADESREEFGPHLRQAREKRGMSLQQVAATTKISARVLEALERNDPSKLPGGIFSRAFVRAYAKEVGLDPEATVNRFVSAFQPDTEEDAPQLPSRTVDAEGFESRRRTATTIIQIVALSLLVVIVAAIYMRMRPAPPPIPAEPQAAPATATPAQGVAQPSGAAPVTDTGATTPPGAGEEASGAGAAPPTASTQPPPAAPPPGPSSVSATPATPGAVPAPAATPATVPQAPGAPGASPAAAPASQPALPLSVTITADAECWLSLSVDGTRVVARNLQAGERVEHAARNAIVISAGNAGALSLAINGKPVRPLGGRGAVVTTTITPDTLRNFIQ